MAKKQIKINPETLIAVCISGVIGWCVYALVVGGVNIRRAKMYRETLPHYLDSLVTLDKKYADSVFVWSDAVNNSDNVGQRNAAAQKLGYYWAKREKLVAKHDSVSNLVQRYHNSLYSKQK